MYVCTASLHYDNIHSLIATLVSHPVTHSSCTSHQLRESITASRNNQSKEPLAKVQLHTQRDEVKRRDWQRKWVNGRQKTTNA